MNSRVMGLDRAARWHSLRLPWLAIALLGVVQVLIAHSLFQDWLHMQPCEQCVYIRFGNIVMAVGALTVALRPESIFFKITGSFVAALGIGYTIACAQKLIAIHNAVHSDDVADMFGLAGCSMQPHYPFGLPLDRWSPSWFAPTGDCGLDAPVVAFDARLSELQRWFIELYQASDGWYLIPQWRFMNMAECCLVISIVCALFLAWLWMGWAVSRARQE